MTKDSWIAWYWEDLIFWVTAIAVGLTLGFLVGCGGGPSVRQQPTATVEAEGDVSIEQPTISEIARDLTAKIESVGGNMTQVGHKLDEQRRMLEETRLEQQQAADMSKGMLLAGIIIVLAVAPNVFPTRITILAVAVGLGLMVGAFIIPGLLY